MGRLICGGFAEICNKPRCNAWECNCCIPFSIPLLSTLKRSSIFAKDDTILCQKKGNSLSSKGNIILHHP